MEGGFYQEGWMTNVLCESIVLLKEESYGLKMWGKSGGVVWTI